MDVKEEVEVGDKIRLNIDKGWFERDGIVSKKDDKGMIMKYDNGEFSLEIDWKEFDETIQVTILEKNAVKKNSVVLF